MLQGAIDCCSVDLGSLTLLVAVAICLTQAYKLPDGLWIG